MIYDWSAEFQMALHFLRSLRWTAPLGVCVIACLGLIGDRPTRDPRLVSYEPLPPDDMAECTNASPSNGFSLMAGELPLRTVLLQARLLAGAGASRGLGPKGRGAGAHGL